jgi:hypothetical protein
MPPLRAGIGTKTARPRRFRSPASSTKALRAIPSAKTAQTIQIEDEAENAGEIRRGPVKILNSVLEGICIDGAGPFRAPPSPWNCKDGASCR